MNKTVSALVMVAVATGALSIGAPAAAKKKDDVQLTRCETSLGSIAVVEGDTQGWSEYGLGSPRELINTLANESGCFTAHSPAAGTPADFLMNVIAGSSEEVDQSIEIAKGAAMEGLLRSGAASSVLGRVPGAGAVLGMFGGFGGKKKRLAAGIKLLSPATGQTIVTGQGVVKKSTLSFRGGGTPWVAGAQASGYGDDKKGRMLVEAFILAFNEVVAQEATIASVPKMAAAAPASKLATVASATSMHKLPSTSSEKVRSLMVGTTLTPTGKREGLFIEATDNFGTTGWVSVEKLN